MEFESKYQATKWTLDIGFTESTGKRNQHHFPIKVKCELDRITVQNNCTDRINDMAVHSKQNIKDIQKANCWKKTESGGKRGEHKLTEH